MSRLRLGLQGNTEIIKCGRDTDRQSHVESAYRRTQKIIAVGSAESSLLCDLEYAVKQVEAIDAEATEHTLHRQGIGCLKHRRGTCGCKMMSDPTF